MTPPAPERTGSWFSGERKTGCLHWGGILGREDLCRKQEIKSKLTYWRWRPTILFPRSDFRVLAKKKARDCKIRHGGNCPSQRTRLCFIPSGRFSCWILEGHVRAGKCVFPASFSGMLDLESTSVRGDTISCSASSVPAVDGESQAYCLTCRITSPQVLLTFLLLFLTTAELHHLPAGLSTWPAISPTWEALKTYLPHSTTLQSLTLFIGEESAILVARAHQVILMCGKRWKTTEIKILEKWSLQLTSPFTGSEQRIGIWVSIFKYG